MSVFEEKQSGFKFIGKSMVFSYCSDLNSENLKAFLESLRKKMIRQSNIYRLIKSNQKISLLFSKIINEEYKLALQNNQVNFISLYKRSPEFKAEAFYKEGKETSSQMPFFIISQMFHFYIGILFFLKFLNHALN